MSLFLIPRFSGAGGQNVALAALDQTEANEFAADAARLEGTAVVEETEAQSGEAIEAAEGEAGNAVEATGASDSVETAESVASAVRAAASEATASIEAASELASVVVLCIFSGCSPQSSLPFRGGSRIHKMTVLAPPHEKTGALVGFSPVPHELKVTVPTFRPREPHKAHQGPLPPGSSQSTHRRRQPD